MVSPFPLRRFRSWTSSLFSTVFRPAPGSSRSSSLGLPASARANQRVAGAHRRGSAPSACGVSRDGRNRGQQGHAAPLRLIRLLPRQAAEFGSGVCMGASYSLCCRCRPGVIRRYRKSVAGKATTASRNVDPRVDLSFTSVGSRDHELRLSQMHRRGVAA